MSGTLVLVATPIGNLGDLSPRARHELEAADVVCCEDTRRTGRLLELSGLRARRLLRVDEHTERAAVDEVTALLAAGRRVVLVSDAGTPTVSDPGRRLVAAAVAAGHEVTAVPGPSAVLAALAVSGLAADRFVFEGFLPRRGRERAERLAALAGEARTVVLYESPHRVGATLADLAAALGPERYAVVARELTKLHEQVQRATLGELAERLGELKGEVVIVVEGAAPPPPADDEVVRAALSDELAAGASRRDAAATVAEALGVRRRRAYELALGLDAADGPVAG